jgi:hypothetical protein
MTGQTTQLKLGTGGLGDPNGQALHALPSGVGNFNQQGLESALGNLHANPNLVASTLQQLQNDPKAYAVHTFNLTEQQTLALYQMSDAQVQQIAAPAIHALQEGNVDPGQWRLNIGPVHVSTLPTAPAFQAREMANALPVLPGGFHLKFSCSCSIEI